MLDVVRWHVLHGRSRTTRTITGSCSVFFVTNTLPRTYTWHQIGCRNEPHCIFAIRSKNLRFENSLRFLRFKVLAFSTSCTFLLVNVLGSLRFPVVLNALRRILHHFSVIQDIIIVSFVVFLSFCRYMQGCYLKLGRSLSFSLLIDRTNFWRYIARTSGTIIK